MTRILLVEDSPTDRKLLKYLLDAQMSGRARFHEAMTLRQALDALDSNRFDCVILDLQLPDSVGRETFLKIYAQHPDVPIIIMTNNRDRDLAMDMVRRGATDYVVKNLNDEDEIFRRVALAIERHRTTVHANPDDAASYNRLKKMRTSLREVATETDASPSTVRNVTIEATMAITDLSHKIFAQLQHIGGRVEKMDVRQHAMSKKVDSLEAEILHGYPDRPSMRSQVDLLEHRVDGVERSVERTEEVDVRVKTMRVENWGKIVAALLGLVGLIAASAIGGAFTYWAAVEKGGGKGADAVVASSASASASAPTSSASNGGKR